MMTMEPIGPIIPSELYDYVYQEEYKRVIDELENYQTPDAETYLEDCIILSCGWLSEHTDGCRKLSCQTTMDRIIDSIRQECHNSVIERTGLNSYTIKLSETSWTIYRIVTTGWSNKIKIRIAYKHYSHRGFIPTNKSAWILNYVDSLIPAFKMMAQTIFLEGNRHMMITAIQQTAKKARRRK